jgi:signal transduction histidine kinase
MILYFKKTCDIFFVFLFETFLLKLFQSGHSGFILFEPDYQKHKDIFMIFTDTAVNTICSFNNLILSLQSWLTSGVKVIMAIIIILLIAVILFFWTKNILKQKISLEKLVRERILEIEEKNRQLIEQTKALNETNALLEERQQHIAEQTEKLMAQKKEQEDLNEQLNETNTLLEERQQLIEEQAEQLQAQAEYLEEVNQNLITLNATKDKFFSIIAHDLKNPFTSILGFSEMLLSNYDKLAEEKKRQYIEIIYNSSMNVYKLLENLLEWARTQTGTINFEPELFNINPLLDNNIELIKDKLSEKGIVIEKHSQGEALVYADKNMINTVIRNLLTNAVKFTENGKIRIEIKPQNNYWECSISDTGTGIPQQKLQAIFSVEKSKSSPGTRGETGTGLGLILCKEFVEKNGGEIRVESTEGKGSTFYFTVPAKQDV